jgi:hypothetical protein
VADHVMDRESLVERLDRMAEDFRSMADHWRKASPERAAAYDVARTFVVTLASQAKDER